MGVYKRTSSKYWYIQFQFGGRTYVRSSKTTEKSVAKHIEQEWRRTLHAQLELGVVERIKLVDALDRYVDSKSGIASYRNIQYRAKRLAGHFGPDKHLDQLTYADLESLQKAELTAGNGGHTISHLFTILRGTRRYAARNGYAVPDVEFPPVATPKHPLRYLSMKEETALLRELDPLRMSNGLSANYRNQVVVRRDMQDNYDLVVLLLDTGARYSEIAKLRWSQIKLADRAIHLWRSKVSNESILYLTDRAFQLLSRRARSSNSGFVFENRSGKARNYAPISIRKAFSRAGVRDCTIHTLRHTHASRLIQNGMSIYEVKEILGHADITTTMRYVHLEQQAVSERARDVIERVNSCHPDKGDSDFANAR